MCAFFMRAYNNWSHSPSSTPLSLSPSLPPSTPKATVEGGDGHDGGVFSARAANSQGVCIGGGDRLAKGPSLLFQHR